VLIELRQIEVVCGASREEAPFLLEFR
jgi:hypothetical protein